MKALRNLLDRQGKLFESGGPLEKLHPLYEAADTILYTPGKTTRGASHVRDALDMKRMMFVVVAALLPCVYMALYNTGYQAHLAIEGGAAALDTWQTSAMQSMGLAFSSSDVLACIAHGALYFLPVLIVTFAIGGGWEVIFAVARRHEVNEGFLVTGMLFPLVLPATIPLWQVALGISFGVIIGKEVFGGTGMNILNPALTARVFLFFAYPAEISGDQVWTSAQTSADGYSGATWLAEAAVAGPAALDGSLAWRDAFLGLVPGSMGETSTLACLVGAAVLILTGIGSWRIMVSLAAGSFAISTLLNVAASATNPMLEVPFAWHVVLGGWAFGAVFMATDPVSAAHTNTGKYVYGFLIGVMAILIRAVNPAFPEGMMLAILFMNVFAALIDYFVVRANIRRRAARYAA
jgi:Na+-transporting NADH:ubiquinone oxidoreductase subunit B